MGTEDFEKLLKIEITAPKPEDAEGIQQLLYKSWLATFPNEKVGITTDDIEDRFKGAFTAEKLARIAQDIADPPPGTAWRVAKNKNKVVGFSETEVRESENELNVLHVAPDIKRRGIGSALWQEAQKLIDAQKDTVLQVADYNENTIEFYKSLGFVDTGERFQDPPMKSGAHRTMMKMVLKARPAV